MDDFENIRSETLDRIAHGDSSGLILAIASHFEPGIFPSLAPAFGEALAGIRVSDRPGSCAVAVADGEIVECRDVANDERFAAEWRDLCTSFGLNALTSFPAEKRDGTVLGTFVVAYGPEQPLDRQARERATKYAALCGQVLAYRRREEGQELIVGELQHRTRNLINTIGALVYSTLKTNPDTESFRRVLDGRLAAMARAHSLALDPDNTDLRQLVIDTLAPYSIDHQITVEGPALHLAKDSALAFCLATHELATIAVKYGSLSEADGRLDISWNFDTDEKGRFHFDWVETGGPEVSEPTKRGFGQRTIHAGFSSAFDGMVEMEYPSEGFRLSLIAPRSVRLGSLVN